MAIDRTSKVAFAQLRPTAGKLDAAQSLRDLVAAVPSAIHTVLTDDGIQFTNRTCDRYAFHQNFDRVCGGNAIKHRLAKVKNP